MRLDDYEEAILVIAQEISFYLQKSGASQADSQDIAQDVLVKILETDIVLPYDKLRAWLYRSAIRTYIDKYRRDKRYHEILQTEFFKPDQLTVYDGEDYDYLYQAISSLPEKFGLVLDAYYFQDLSVKETAHLLGISQAQVKVSLYRARKALRVHLEAQGLDGSLLNLPH
ncbi:MULTISPECIES: RNA polymerase sigma factor [unclassified Streptococcus]|uniref:RNA polymerase sigma factor n=1 Tax=unclassified Streptococcus TaxID=2608887 RepID=UPI00359D7825